MCILFTFFKVFQQVNLVTIALCSLWHFNSFAYFLTFFTLITLVSYVNLDYFYDLINNGYSWIFLIVAFCIYNDTNYNFFLLFLDLYFFCCIFVFDHTRFAWICSDMTWLHWTCLNLNVMFLVAKLTDWITKKWTELVKEDKKKLKKMNRYQHTICLKKINWWLVSTCGTHEIVLKNNKF